ncbi:hypothetical protein [Sphingomonas sanxanigenens]|uniref:Uncharacterized protein n=1 Tax=Sphingomonas sanxanigenens DSM 19645 = NX02 TaxID=1123269 RepID=W0A8C6_9SPHN|nr:hypothetical protein [Sphingomonas sanxanigenens]AHE52737.1 hypothetical protein NX02_04980 [Sphingomonas sanxanigenens DSM 19645 = NX02]
MANTYRLREQALFPKPAQRSHKPRIRLLSRDDVDPPAGGGAFLIAASAVAGFGVWAALLSVIL